MIYQPQIRDWQKFQELTADTAISITQAGTKPVLGVASWGCSTLTNTQTRMVVITNCALNEVRFPSLDAIRAESMQRMLQQNFASPTMTISLDRMLASFKAIQAPPRIAAISTQPPPILMRQSPAILLFVDGDPILVPVEGTHLKYVVNTNWDVISDGSHYYLLNGKTWVTASALAGPWKVTTKLPPDMAKLPAGQSWDQVRKAIPAQPATTAAEVVFTNKPGELILFKGKPVYSSIPGTKLLYARNTENDVFQYTLGHQVYVLLSGRWFSAATLNGPWTYAGNNLPEDFMDIPASHPKARVMTSVPGTQEARDAVLLAQVPTTVMVDRAKAEAQAKVVYTGDPQFKSIEGTSLSYAVNTQDKVIKVGDLYYLCFQGVWFMSTGANGPWKTADSVPKEIYTIPPSAPIYNVTYVTVSNPTPTTVESSSTAGYMGMFVLGATVGACIAYGTGYYYPPYYYWGPHPYPIYYPYPYSYGYRAVYNPATGFYGIGTAVYGPYGSAGRAAWYNPSTGRYGRSASVQTAYGGRTAAQTYNPWTGNWASTRQGHNPYSQWGSSTIKYNNQVYHTGHVKTANDLYAGADGNVYRRDSNGNWTKWNNGGWSPVDNSAHKTGVGGTGEYRGNTGQTTNATQRTRQATSPTTSNATQRPTPPSTGQTGARQGQERQGATTPAAQRQPSGESANLTQRQKPASTDAMQQLNRDYSARQEGAARERSFSGNLGGAARGGGRRR